MNYFFAFDTETGGIDCSKVDLLTFYGAIYDENWTFLDEIELFLKPGNRRPIAEDMALSINKINLDEHLKATNTVPYCVGNDLLVNFLSKYHQKIGRYNNIRPFGQNITFDIGFIQQYLLPKEQYNSLLHYGNVDLKCVIEFLKDCKWFPEYVGSLESTVDFLGLPNKDFHNAKNDTLMAVEVYKYILQMMKNKW